MFFKQIKQHLKSSKRKVNFLPLSLHELRGINSLVNLFFPRNKKWNLDYFFHNQMSHTYSQKKEIEIGLKTKSFINNRNRIFWLQQHPQKIYKSIITKIVKIMLFPCFICGTRHRIVMMPQDFYYWGGLTAYYTGITWCLSFNN
jgi:hypothetical protein